MKKLTVRKAKPEYAKILSALAIRSKASWGYEKSWLEACKPELVISESQLENWAGYVVEIDNEIAGFWCREIKEDLSDGRLFVEPKFIKHGCGRMLWKALRNDLMKSGLKYITLLADPNAAPFYIKLGGKELRKEDSQIFPGRKLPVIRIPLQS